MIYWLKMGCCSTRFFLLRDQDWLRVVTWLLAFYSHSHASVKTFAPEKFKLSCPFALPLCSEDNLCVKFQRAIRILSEDFRDESLFLRYNLDLGLWPHVDSRTSTHPEPVYDGHKRHWFVSSVLSKISCIRGHARVLLFKYGKLLSKQDKLLFKGYFPFVLVVQDTYAASSWTIKSSTISES